MPGKKLKYPLHSRGSEPGTANRPAEERRSTTRVNKRTLVHISSPEEWGRQVNMAIGRTINLSTAGMRLELKSGYSLPLRSTLGLSLSLGETILEVKGRVIYLQSLNEEYCAVGIQFLGLSREDRESLQQLIESEPVQE